MINSINSSAMGLIQQGQNRLDTAASNVAAGSVDDVKALTRDLVNARLASREVEAGTKLLKAADEMLGSLFDDFA